MHEFPLLRRIQKRAGFLAIPNLMMILTGAMAIVYLFESFFRAQYGVSLYSMLYFDRAAIFAGQIWRVFTFLFIPVSSGLLWTILSLMLYLYFGRSLENAWGSFGFTVYYLLGALGAVLSGFFTGYATNTYLNLSLFFAYALLDPNHQLYIFFFIPVKMKWLMWLEAAVFLWSFFLTGWGGKLAMLMAIVNVLLFFWRIPIEWVKNKWRWIQWKRKWKK